MSLPIGRFLRAVDRPPGDPGLNLVFFCPACQCGHGVSTRPPGPPGPVWTVKGTPEAPTIEPSVKVTGYEMSAEGEAMLARGEHPAPGQRYPGKDTCCHSVVTDGQIHYAPDSTHALSGQTVPMVEF